MQSEDTTSDIFRSGLYYVENGNYESAVDCFDRAIVGDPKNITSHIHREECHFQNYSNK